MQQTKKPGFFSRPSKDQCKDAGMALILILLLVTYFGKHPGVTPWTMGATLLLMIQPKAFKPFAALWFGFSEVMGTIMSKVILSLIFYLMVAPLGILKRATGGDTLKLKQWKAGRESVLRDCSGEVTPKDLERIF